MTARVWAALEAVRERIWFTAAIYAVIGIAVALVARFAAPYLPQGAAIELGSGAVDSVLTILASSMLTVTTFSLGTVISAFFGAASNVTPRATGLLAADGTSQRVLSTFLGAFIFSLVGIIGLQSGLYDERSRFVLFVATVALVVLIVIAMLRWIGHLNRFGLRDDTHGRIEAAAAQALAERIEAPFLGGRPADGPPPAGARPVLAEAVGYVRRVDIAGLDALAARAGAAVQLAASPGGFVHLRAPLAFVWQAGEPEEEKLAPAAFDARLRECFIVEPTRAFAHDPRFGLVVMSETMEKALSPAINDTGTVVDMLGRAVRVLSRLAERGRAEIEHPRVAVPPLSTADLIDDVFGGVARTGAAGFAVHVRLQKALAALAGLEGAGFGPPARAVSAAALAAATPHLAPADRAAVAALAERVAATG
ncbi:DUF2254 domain-containing protein [Prosthecomicrobium pneumaticum]|uniref:Putative membrane protein n=1 Tax=Prosthecomicrobium pneumaticum TaxID=81895 RepID=A0A7W9FKV9_9HYPH|nr:DUF2254 domain-containing protein [Prosthecomicrobium pneumaticum]MBB5751693.1 putative membrane protein [Prosthecomicrobium pneumaticum]